MRKVLVTFGGAAYDETTGEMILQAGFAGLGASHVWVYDDKWLMEQTEYYDVNAWIFAAKSRIHGEGQHGAIYQHGFGWCSWKAFIIQSAWDRLKDGDVVLYLDADCYPVAPFGHLFDACSAAGGVYLFEEHASSLRFTKGDCFAVMGLPYEEIPHACGRFSLWQKGSFLARQMLAEWWAYSINPRCTLWDSSILVKDKPEYYRNSTEQSVLSNLAAKYSIPLHPIPDQGGLPENRLFHQEWCKGDRSDYSGSKYRNV